MAAFPLWPSLVAVIVAEPWVTPVASPSRETVATLEMAYRSPAILEVQAAFGLSLVQQPRFRWSAIARQFDRLLTAACEVR